MIFRKDEQDYSGNVYPHSVLERVEKEVNDKLSFEEDYGATLRGSFNRELCLN